MGLQNEPIWQVGTAVSPPGWLAKVIQLYLSDAPGFAQAAVVQLLAQRGWGVGLGGLESEVQQRQSLLGFLDPQCYEPCPASAFGVEMERAIARLLQAQERGEAIAIWGDFDADGVTATALLWEGLLPWFGERLGWWIPNRLTESHGLNRSGLERLAAQGVRVIVTCDTGSGDRSELAYAQSLGVDVIVTDHHSVPSERPPVVAILNPRCFPVDHPLATLSGVAVAYKLMEAVVAAFPNPAPGVAGGEEPGVILENLLDLVAIGLIADLVELRGDCRYLAQVGLLKLQELVQSRTARARRPGVAALLERCQRSGDRPSDIAFGLGPRINAVSRVLGDAQLAFGVLTCREDTQARAIADQIELLNARRREIQRRVLQEAEAQLQNLDLSTTAILVLSEVGWPVGVLGLVAGQLSQAYGRPVILLSQDVSKGGPAEPTASGLARGSARSPGLDLYPLLAAQAHLLQRFGGHPYAAGLSLPSANIPLLREALNQQVRQQGLRVDGQGRPTLRADLMVTVAQLGQPLFRALKLLEPHGMGNPPPQLLLRRVWFEQVRHRNLQDWRGQTVRYIRTSFRLRDGGGDRSPNDRSATAASIAGSWWGHYADELPPAGTPCDAIGQLEYNPAQRQYEFRLLGVRPSPVDGEIPAVEVRLDWILDQRGVGWGTPPESQVEPKLQSRDQLRFESYIEYQDESRKGIQDKGQGVERPTVLPPISSPPISSPPISSLPISSLPISPLISPSSSLYQGVPVVWRTTPTDWADWRSPLRRAQSASVPLVLAYGAPPVSAPETPPDLLPEATWYGLVGIAKYLARTGEGRSRLRLQERLQLPEGVLPLAWEALAAIGFRVRQLHGEGEEQIAIAWENPSLATLDPPPPAIAAFLDAIAEVRFRQRYFTQIPLPTIQAVAAQLL